MKSNKKLIYFKSMIFILIFGVFLSVELNAKCEVRGYYRANGTWVEGYTKSGECWQGNVIGYDAEGQTTKERKDRKIKSNRKKMPFLFVIVGLLAIFRHKVKEGSYLRIFVNIFFFPLFIYFLFIVASDLILIFILIVSYIIWEIILDKKKKKSKKISQTHLSTTAISDLHNIKDKFQLFNFLEKNNLIYRNTSSSFKLTKEGFDIGGEYRTNTDGLEWIVWKKNCLDDYINKLKILNENKNKKELSTIIKIDSLWVKEILNVAETNRWKAVVSTTKSYYMHEKNFMNEDKYLQFMQNVKDKGIISLKYWKLLDTSDILDLINYEEFIEIDDDYYEPSFQTARDVFGEESVGGDGKIYLGDGVYVDANQEW